LVGGAIANSPLVKTAFYASDPNLGRILAAIGNAEIQNFKIDDLELKINDYCVFKHGEISVDYDESVAKKEMNNKEIVVEVNLKRGKITGNFYSCDFSHEYITINSDYRS